jgi:peptidoglycan hydrolase-like protein with peptidoglycan-binding domain
MVPIRKGDRGPAVEDVQRRLLSLGYDLGPTGVDGVFLGATLAAVVSFQRSLVLTEDGIVGPETWAALVDATFTLGDRLLYLRLPYFHGRDVRVLQGALNALGFACGQPDGIFGAYTERAVHEFQVNTGQPADGIVGTDTVRALTNLRHVWVDKDPTAPVALKLQSSRASEVLRHASVVARHADGLGREVAERLANLAAAAHPDAVIAVQELGEALPAGARVVLTLSSEEDAGGGVPRVRVSGGYDSSLATRFVTAMESARGAPLEVVVELSAGDASDERWLQHSAVGLLDGLCAALADMAPSVLS